MANRTRRLDIEIASEQKGSGWKDTGRDADKLAADINAAGAKAKGAFQGLDADAKGLGSRLSAARKAASAAFNGIEADARGLGPKLDAAGKSAGTKLGDSIRDGAKGKLDSFGDELKESLGAAGGVAAGVGFAAAFSEALDRGAGADVVSAGLGLSPEQSRVAGNVAGRLYADAYGGSMEDVNLAIESVGSTLTSVTAGNEADLERLTAKAMDVATVFRMDVADASRLAGVAIQHGLARDADHAFDLITASMQRMPASMREELLPTIEEYGSFLHNMGFSGEEAFGLLAEASKGGSFEIDKTADALKELSIRAVDMSDTSVQAFNAAGLNAEDMAGRFLAGGDTARGALDDLVSGLLAMEDPVQRQIAAVKLFGAPLEDLSVNEIPQFLEGLQSANTSLGDVAGAAEEAGAIVNDNLKTKLTGLQRQALAPVISTVDTLTSGFLALPGPVQAIIGGLGGISAASVPVIWAGKKVAESWRTAVEWTGNMRTKAADLSGSLDLGSRAGGRLGGVLGKLRGAAALAGTALVGVGVAAAGLEIFNQLRVNRVADEIRGLADVDTGQLNSVRDGLRTYREELEQLEEREGKGRLFSVMGANVFATGGDADRQERIDQLRDSISELEDTEGTLEDQERQLASAYLGSDSALGGLNEETSNAVSQLQEYSDTLRAQFDPLFGMLDALSSNRDATARVAEAQAALNEARRGGDAGEIAAAEQALAQAHRDATGSALDLTAASNQLKAGIQAGTVSVQDANAQLMAWVGQGLISGDTARAMAADFDVAAFSASALGATDPNVNVTETGTRPVGGIIGWLRGEVLSVPTRRNTNLTATDNASNTAASVRRMIDSLPRTRTIDIAFRTGVIPQILYGGARAGGGPVDAGRLYEVAEQGKAELLEMGGRTYMIPGGDGRVVPSGELDGTGSGAGGFGALGGRITGAIEDATSRQIAADAVHTHWAVGQLMSELRWLEPINVGVWIPAKRLVFTTSAQLAGRSVEDALRYWLTRVPDFDSGGVVPGPVGAPRLIKAHGGEVVSTPEQAASGDTYVLDFRGATFMTEGDFERAVVRALNHAGKKGVRLKVQR